MDNYTETPLSPQVEQRRERMLADLLGEVRRVRRTRRVLRRVAGVSSVAVAAALALTVLGPGDVPFGRGRHAQVSTGGQHPRVTVSIVQTDPDVLKRLRAEPTGDVVLLDDRALVETLTALNRPAGVVRTPDGAWLTAPVTDEELRQQQ